MCMFLGDGGNQSKLIQTQEEKDANFTQKDLLWGKSANHSATEPLHDQSNETETNVIDPQGTLRCHNSMMLNLQNKIPKKLKEKYNQ